MNWEQVRVLIDGYNLELPKGTGVKTYGMSLIQALTTLGAKVDVLYSLPLQKNERFPAITEALFFDPNARPPGRLSKLRYALEIFKPVASQPEMIEIGNVVIRDRNNILSDRLSSNIGVLNLPWCYRLANQYFKKLNWQKPLKLPYKIDIWHATYPLPITIEGAKKITTIHDLIPLRLPYTTLDDKDLFYRTVKRSIETSALIIAVSENTRQDLIDIYQCPPEKIYNTYQPVPLNKDGAKLQKLGIYLRKYNLQEQQYILFVGAIEPKKNLGRLLDAYAMSDTDLPLVIVGKKGWFWKQDLAKLDFLFKNSQKKAIVLDYLPREDLTYLYRGAYCLVFPSLYEGFGLPPLEAMGLGCPVITSNVSSLPEVCGDAALYIDPYNIEDIADRLNELISDRTLRDNLAAAGIQRANSFGMETYLTRISQAYQQVLFDK
jgi:glycosyltransferase involved in cell wall biosynthesis